MSGPPIKLLKHSYLCTQILLLIGTALLAGCGHEPPPKKVEPSVVSNPVAETKLTTVQLTPQASRRLGITLGTVQNQQVTKMIHLPGEIMAAPGQVTTVSAPWTGKLLPARGTWTTGTHVQRGQVLFSLTAVMPEQTGLGVQKPEVQARQKQVELVKAKVKRLEQLAADQTVSEKLVQEAKAELANAEAALDAASIRQRYLQGQVTKADAAAYSNIKLTAPVSGTLQKIYNTGNQMVSAGTPLFDVANLNVIWVRVPIYSGDRGSVDTSSSAKVAPPGQTSNAQFYTAEPVSGPSTGDPLAATTDLYYALPNGNGNFQIGQKVTVMLPQKGSLSKHVIPYSAVVYDLEGGTWVYKMVAENTYSRQRISVDYIRDGMAVLNRGLDIGTKIVTSGAAEIFGTEFGADK